MEQHAIIAHFEYAVESLDALYAVEEQLEAAINAAGVGEFDGMEIAVDLSDGSLYMYGPNAEALFAAVPPILAGAECLHNTRVTLRFGPPEDDLPEGTLRPRPHNWLGHIRTENWNKLTAKALDGLLRSRVVRRPPE